MNWVHDIIRQVWHEEMPGDWKKRKLVPIYKNKDVLLYSNYRGIKLTEHVLKTVARIVDRRLRELNEIDQTEFGLLKGRGTVDAIFVLSQIQEKTRKKR